MASTPRPGSGSRDISSRWHAALRARLREAAGGAPFVEIGRRTGTHPETVRRYLRHGLPTTEFVAAFSLAYAVPSDWLLGLGSVASAPPRPPTRAERDLARAAAALDEAREALESARRRR